MKKKLKSTQSFYELSRGNFKMNISSEDEESIGVYANDRRVLETSANNTSASSSVVDTLPARRVLEVGEDNDRIVEFVSSGDELDETGVAVTLAETSSQSPIPQQLVRVTVVEETASSDGSRSSPTRSSVENVLDDALCVTIDEEEASDLLASTSKLSKTTTRLNRDIKRSHIQNRELSGQRSRSPRRNHKEFGRYRSQSRRRISRPHRSRSRSRSWRLRGSRRRRSKLRSPRRRSRSGSRRYDRRSGKRRRSRSQSYNRDKFRKGRGRSKSPFVNARKARTSDRVDLMPLHESGFEVISLVEPDEKRVPQRRNPAFNRKLKGTDSCRVETGLQASQWRGSFLQQSLAVLDGTLVSSQQQLQAEPVTSSTLPPLLQQEFVISDDEVEVLETVPKQNELKLEGNLVEVKKSEIKETISTLAQEESNVVIILLRNTNQLPTASDLCHSVHADMDMFTNTSHRSNKNQNCKNIPCVEINSNKAKLVFKHKAQAKMFLKKYSSCYKSHKPNISYGEPELKANMELKDLSKVTFGKLTKGTLRAGQLTSSPKTYLLCTVTMTCMRSASVASGLVSSPARISITSRQSSFARNVLPVSILEDVEILEKNKMRKEGGKVFKENELLFDEDAHPDLLFSEMKKVVNKHLKQSNPNSLFDEAILVFKSWEEADVFLKWTRQAKCEKILEQIVSHLGVVKETEIEGDCLEEMNTHVTSVLRLQEENNHFYEKILENLNNTKKFFSNFLSSHCLSMQSILGVRNPLQEKCVQESNSCILSLEFTLIKEELTITQIGACMFNKINDNIQKLHFSCSASDEMLKENPEKLQSEFGISKDDDRNWKYEHKEQNKKYSVVTEKEALDEFMRFVKNNEAISGRVVPSTMLITYASSSTLPVLLQAVARNLIEKEFYKTFSSFSDFHTVGKKIDKNLFKGGIPSLMQFSAKLDVMNSKIDHPANGMASLLHTCLKKSNMFEEMKKQSLPVSELKFSKKNCEKEPLLIDKRIRIESGSRSTVDFSLLYTDTNANMILIPNPKLMEKVDILSYEHSHKLTVIIKNRSGVRNCWLQPGEVFGNLVAEPTALCIPSPSFLHGELSTSALKKQLTTNQLGFKENTDEQDEQDVEIEMASSPTLRILPVFEDNTNGSYFKINDKCKSERASMSLQCYTDYKPKLPLDVNPKKLKRSEIKNCNIFTLSIKTIEVNGTNHLMAVSLYHLTNQELTLSRCILPKVLSSTFPADNNFYCRRCKSQSSFHLQSDCPLQEVCERCPEKVNHEKVYCRSKVCWNCGENSHGWRKCGKPLISKQQRSFYDLGFRFKMIKSTVAENKLERCVVDIANNRCRMAVDVVGEMQRLLSKSQNIVIGFNIAEILLDIFSCILQFSYLTRKMLDSIDGIADIRWLLESDAREDSLAGISERLLGVSRGSADLNPDEIVKRVAEIANASFDGQNISRIVRFNQQVLSDLFDRDIHTFTENEDEYLNNEQNLCKEDNDVKPEIIATKDEADEILLFVNISLENGIAIDILVTALKDRMEVFNKAVGVNTSEQDSSEFFNDVQSCVNLFNTEVITAVFICPQSFVEFSKMFFKQTGIGLELFCSRWVCLLSSALSSVHLTALPFDVENLTKLTKKFNIRMELDSCVKMKIIFNELRSHKNLMEKPFGFSPTLVTMDLSIILADITVDEDSPSRISSIALKELTEGDDEVTKFHSGDGASKSLSDFFDQLKKKHYGKSFVFMTLENDRSIPVLIAHLIEDGIMTSDEVVSFFSGVGSFQECLTKLGEENSFDKLISKKGENLRVNQMSNFLLDILSNNIEADKLIPEFFHPLDSPHFNKLLLDSDLKTFDANLRLVLQESCIVPPESLLNRAVTVEGMWGTVEPGATLLLVRSCLPSLEVELGSRLIVTADGLANLEMVNVREEENVSLLAGTILATAILQTPGTVVYLICE